MTTLTLNRNDITAMVSNIVNSDALATFVAAPAPAPAPVAALLASIQAGMVPTDAPAPAPAPAPTKCSVKTMEKIYPDLKQLNAIDFKQQSTKVLQCRAVLRMYAAHAFSGSDIDLKMLSEKSLKGASMSTKVSDRVILVQPEKNEWVNLSESEAIEALGEMATMIMASIEGAPVVKKTSSELDKARKYIGTLSAETLAALRNEGVI